MRNPLGGWAVWFLALFWSNEPVSEMNAGFAGLVVLIARCAGVVRSPVVLLARCAQHDRVPLVVRIMARYAGVIVCQCGALMPRAHEHRWPARPTRRCSRPLRAQDRRLFDPLSVVRLRQLNGNPFGAW